LRRWGLQADRSCAHRSAPKHAMKRFRNVHRVSCSASLRFIALTLR
jgi:hypothetical protein